MESSSDSIRTDDYRARLRLPPDAEVAAVTQDGRLMPFGPVNKRQLRVLVADDCPDTAGTMSMMVKLWGHAAWVATNGAATVRMADECRADVLLLDIGMPDLNGYRVARQLRGQARFKDTLLIAVTGWADQTHRLLGEEAGFDFYLVKPVAPSTLEVLLTLERDRLALPSASPGNRRFLRVGQSPRLRRAAFVN